MASRGGKREKENCKIFNISRTKTFFSVKQKVFFMTFYELSVGEIVFMKKLLWKSKSNQPFKTDFCPKTSLIKHFKIYADIHRNLA